MSNGITIDRIDETHLNVIGQAELVREMFSEYVVTPASPTRVFAGVPASDTVFLVLPSESEADEVCTLIQEIPASPKPPTSEERLASLRPIFASLPLDVRTTFAPVMAQVKAALEAGDLELADALIRDVTVPASLRDAKNAMLELLDAEPTKVAWYNPGSWFYA
jgi:hypothetical protein